MSVTRTAAQLATTLAELHDLGWAHGAITPDHLVVVADGSIVWCSLRRAVPIGAVDAPAAAADVDALVLVIESLLPTSDVAWERLVDWARSSLRPRPDAKRSATGR